MADPENTDTPRRDDSPRRLKLASGRRRLVRRGLVGGLAVVLAVAWLVTIATGHRGIDQRDPDKVARQFITEVQQGHPHRAYLLMSPLFQQTTSETTFGNNQIAALIDHVPSTTSPERIMETRPPGGAINGQKQLYYRYELAPDPGSDSQSGYFIGITLVQQDNKWGVQSIHEPKTASQPEPGFQFIKDTKR